MKYFIAFLIIGVIFTLKDYLDYKKYKIDMPNKYILMSIILWPFDLISDVIEIIQEILKK
jgi:hypothetical protein